jgi:hypothetical protein
MGRFLEGAEMIDILIDLSGLLFLVFLGASVAVFFLLHKGWPDE